MDENLIDELRYLDEHYWWHVSKQNTIIALLGGAAAIKGMKVLEVGFGSAVFLKKLQALGAECWGVDTSPASIGYAKCAGLENIVRADVNEGMPQLPKDFFDTVVLADFIEHIKDDVGFLRQITTLLKNDGKVIIAVPAFGCLWSYWDEANGHERRYTSKSLRNVVKSAGLRATFMNYYFFIAFVPAVVIRLLIGKKRRSGGTEFFPVNASANKLLIAICSAERTLFKKIKFPFGVSVYCLAEKTEI